MLKAYFATSRMRALERGYFGLAELIGGYGLKLAQLLALMMIWRALGAGGAGMDGASLSQLLAYTALSSALSPLLDVRTPASGWHHGGELLGCYMRPMGIFRQLSALAVGDWLMPLALFGAPVIAISALSGIPMRPASGWFFLSLALAVSVGFAVDFLFACLMIQMRHSEWTLHSLRGALGHLLTGAVVPFSILPWGLGRWLQYTPFAAMAGAPLSLFTGMAEPLETLAAQGFWNLALWPAALIWFSRLRERMASYGG